NGVANLARMDEVRTSIKSSSKLGSLLQRISRRELLGAAGMAVAPQAGQHSTSSPVPWYRRAYRWGQTNIVEKDPERYDIEWWRRQWKETYVQAVIINAGGIVAYYP